MYVIAIYQRYRRVDRRTDRRRSRSNTATQSIAR